MPIIPAWLLIVLALLSAHVVRRQQGFGVAIPRFYIAVLYLVISLELLGDPALNNQDYVAINRYGFLLLFIVDTFPAFVVWLRGVWKRRGTQ